ncbi:DUF368 domain-containing protein [Ignavibacteria bacterium CHB1]|nr:MAG: DUF368 domain-containing protein [Chlorobiota bacterium]MBV6398951.1 hypothetical protein [Ignavibacteria bacterium]MCC6886211.1 DUF368 domain-containing protein [Ignavibacteriales bacterium]MCE7953859.1 DUF368 domain-containing protein [Chlorobi bacterium CHB7]MDL1887826.1 DUF368 domain-containing protein [Ignavibacteria bacterium CHB1]RIK47877.1 MAG: DUF368 domain-containing protein [Ignavibacteriota bacterium]
MKNLLLYLRGIGIGMADLIPGVSGGTIAFITGIYERLVSALHNIDHHALKLLVKLKFREFFRKIDALFLLLVVGGAATSILIFSKLIEFLLKNYETYLWAFFFGLILSSIYIVIKKVKHLKVSHSVYFIAGAIIAYFVTSSSIIKTPDSPLFLFFAGFIAIIAMILPGISGSYILLILGKYHYVISIVSAISGYMKSLFTSITTGDFGKIVSEFPATEFGLAAIFTLGCISGLISFSKVLNWLFKHHHDNAIAVLAGFMLGSLNVIWPWKKIIGETKNFQGEIVKIQENILPYFNSVDAWLILMFIAIGIIIIYIIEKAGSRNEAV